MSSKHRRQRNFREVTRCIFGGVSKIHRVDVYNNNSYAVELIRFLKGKFSGSPL